VNLVGFIIRIYHDAWSSECRSCSAAKDLPFLLSKNTHQFLTFCVTGIHREGQGSDKDDMYVMHCTHLPVTVTT